MVACAPIAMSIQDPPKRQRWRRSQKFGLSERGRAAEMSYRSSIVASRATGGRTSFEAARVAWADSYRVQPDDGLYLGEVSGAPRNLSELVAALETSGKTKKDALSALERLYDAGLISALDEST